MPKQSTGISLAMLLGRGGAASIRIQSLRCTLTVLCKLASREDLR